MKPVFVKGYQKDSAVRVFDMMNLSDLEKKQMCWDLLEEFGAHNISEKGDELHHSCCLPFGLHKNGDQNPSANLNWKKLTYCCFGCGNSGGLLWFIATCRGESVVDTKRWVRERSEGGDDESMDALLRYIDAVMDPAVKDVVAEIPSLSPNILRKYRYIHPYMTEIRHIREENLMHFQVGWDPDSNRIIFPHFWQDKLVGWQHRRLVNDGSPKYQNTPSFPKDQTLFNWNPEKPVLVLESPMSVIAKAHVWGDYDPIATFGASVTDRQKMILRKAPVVILWFDNDSAGWEATKNVGDDLLKYGADIRVVDNPWAADPADMDDATVQELVQNQIPYAIWSQPEKLKELDADHQAR